jgi:hypothetical protein
MLVMQNTLVHQWVSLLGKGWQHFLKSFTGPTPFFTIGSGSKLFSKKCANPRIFMQYIRVGIPRFCTFVPVRCIKTVRNAACTIASNLTAQTTYGHSSFNDKNITEANEIDAHAERRREGTVQGRTDTPQGRTDWLRSNELMSIVVGGRRGAEATRPGRSTLLATVILYLSYSGWLSFFLCIPKSPLLPWHASCLFPHLPSRCIPTTIQSCYYYFVCT